MEIMITQWALDAYLDLKHGRVFAQDEFNNKIKPDVRLLKEYPSHPKFSNGKFWSSASHANSFIVDGFKMKWHQVGDGKIQLRLPIAAMESAYLCEAYVKKDEKMEKRKLAKFKTHLQLIRQGCYKQCGVIQ